MNTDYLDLDIACYLCSAKGSRPTQADVEEAYQRAAPHGPMALLWASASIAEGVRTVYIKKLAFGGGVAGIVGQQLRRGFPAADRLKPRWPAPGQLLCLRMIPHPPIFPVRSG